MLITRTADYALRAVIHLADAGADRPVAAAEIARAQGIPPDYVAKVLGALARAGLVTCLPGRGGGARLLRRPAEISVLEVVEAVDGPVLLNRCLLREGECPRDRSCAAHGFWKATQQSLLRTLARAKVSQFCRRRGKPQPPAARKR
ncbi:MAG TPA: Rrf2 family transcriptional regulator [Phycisphaerae bacterium]|nr:Rrf2 family transcriptional regulator [Phycisphaerae bacterium]